jgi:hypothetical protein
MWEKKEQKGKKENGSKRVNLYKCGESRGKKGYRQIPNNRNTTKQ